MEQEAESRTSPADDHGGEDQGRGSGKESFSGVGARLAEGPRPVKGQVIQSFVSG